MRDRSDIADAPGPPSGARRHDDVERPVQLIVFSVGAVRCGLALPVVRRLLRAVEITPLPGAPRAVRGVIDVHGTILPVFSGRAKFLQQERDVSPADYIILADAGGQVVGLLVDDVEGAVHRARRDAVAPAGAMAGGDQFEGIVRLDDDLVLIYDLDRFLTTDEQRRLSEAIALHQEGQGGPAGATGRSDG